MARSPRAARAPRGLLANIILSGPIPKVKPAAKTRRSRQGGRTPPAGYRVVTVGNKTRYVRSRVRKSGAARRKAAKISAKTVREVGRYGKG